MTKEKQPRAPAKALTRGITAVGRSKNYHRRGLWAIKEKHGGQFPTHPKKEKAEAAPAKPPRFYPADDVKKPLRRRGAPKPTALRASITPGTVLIILAGRFKGKRVVFLRQLPSGLLLVTGPFAINGVPLRRVNQAYVIATSLKLDVAAADVAKVGDEYFKAPAKARGKKSEEGFFESEQPKKELPAEYIETQKAVDGALTGSLDEDVKGYLAARFTLKAGDRPHTLKF